MRIAVAADERTGVADDVLAELRARGHEPIAHGALGGPDERDDWAWSAEAAARDVADGRAAHSSVGFADAGHRQGVVLCWTGTPTCRLPRRRAQAGASIAANKVAGVRAALCADAATAAGARRRNGANVLALGLRTTSRAELGEILDAWFVTGPSGDGGDAANVAHLDAIR
jgi:ribose 5-phosphate isomerase B